MHKPTPAQILRLVNILHSRDETLLNPEPERYAEIAATVYTFLHEQVTDEAGRLGKAYPDEIDPDTLAQLSYELTEHHLATHAAPERIGYLVHELGSYLGRVMDSLDVFYHKPPEIVPFQDELFRVFDNRPLRKASAIASRHERNKERLAEILMQHPYRWHRQIERWEAEGVAKGWGDVLSDIRDQVKSRKYSDNGKKGAEKTHKAKKSKKVKKRD